MPEKISPEIAERIQLLEKKFKNSGQDMLSYLDGLLYDQYITYWDYIRLDTLLSLQVPSTSFPDEMIFIGYHQITELYFKLVIHEQMQVIEQEQLTGTYFLEKIKRINRYFTVMINSFEVMIKGMEREQFLKFRMSLLPASGFQSAQFRMIELYATNVEHLVNYDDRTRFRESETSTTIPDLFQHIYWKKGGIDKSTGEKTLTLKQFEKRYTPRFLRIAEQVEHSNIYQRYLGLPDSEKLPELKEELRKMDQNVNINWLLMHMGAAHRYLRKEGGTVQATGGTNWKEFLPPSFQRISFFPKLWSQEEHANWGKQWVDHTFNTSTIE
ncbi:Tryptophan 2,3-dioxygenase apoenzyme [Nonlabens sp. Hel1_33_55]|uniref:tryptophan 2,3-dioxygenase family protein n=1 Tax=Nonlabens sp. Hel1_33_55 TaxID=1336802 RepID=UPI000875CC4F|nr:tryptophan 2,3-dioxygenase family protein [Nonlabens sp. Hel1_33_55]SCY28557.1 Tryptophan 2,3-dioxygenase apoenzyme [Nonlabens sp. Hel1_33_55]